MQDATSRSRKCTWWPMRSSEQRQTMRRLSGVTANLKALLTNLLQQNVADRVLLKEKEEERKSQKFKEEGWRLTWKTWNSRTKSVQEAWRLCIAELGKETKLRSRNAKPLQAPQLTKFTALSPTRSSYMPHSAIPTSFLCWDMLGTSMISTWLLRVTMAAWTHWCFLPIRKVASCRGHRNIRFWGVCSRKFLQFISYFSRIS